LEGPAQLDRRMMSQMDLTAALTDCEASRLLLLEEADLLLGIVRMPPANFRSPRGSAGRGTTAPTSGL
jgi:hypothetical protein